MRKILGLDLGVGSIGWAYVHEAENSSEQSSIVKLGVRVVPLTVDEQQNFEKGKSITTNADRALKKSMRRNLQRYKLRRDNLIDCLLKNKIISNETILSESGNNTTFETYRLRAKAATEMVSLEALARILLMLNKKRGYKSNRKANKQEDGTIIDGMSIAKDLYEKDITPGQYVFKRLNENKRHIPEFYNSDLQKEFDRIFFFQQSFYPTILTQELYTAIQGKSGKATYAILSSNNIPVAENKGDDKKRTVYNWRNDAVIKKQPIDIVSHALMELNATISNGSNYLGAIGDRSKELYFNRMTVGQMLMKRLAENPNASLKNIVYYRQDYLDEFECIWETQRKYHNELTQELKKEIRDIIIFYQRELKSKKSSISLCEFEKREIEVSIDGTTRKKITGCRVCPKSSPLFQEFKIWQMLNNIRVCDTETNETWPLDIEEKDVLFKELNIKQKLSKNEILKILYRNSKHLDLNYKEIEGNRTLFALVNACQSIIVATGHDEYPFSKMRASEIYEIIHRIFGAVGFNTDFLHFDSDCKNLEDEPMFKLWHLLYSYTDDKSKTGNESLINKIRELTNMDEECARILANISFMDDYGSLSSKAIRKILPHMQEGNEYSVACMYAGYNHSHSLTKEELLNKVYVDTIELLPRNSLRNPVVEKILNQMINVVNAIVKEYGKPDEIRIELARELKSNAKERKRATEAISEANKKNETVRKILIEKFGIKNPSRNDIVRYRLYEELEKNGYHTLYSNTYIPQEELFTNRFNVEHIIPQACLFDDSFSNKTLETMDINIEKGKETAYDYVLAKYGNEGMAQYKARIDYLYNAGAIRKSKRDKLLMQGKDIPNGFIERELRDTQYIARKAHEILECLVPHVISTTGQITERLREDWHLIDVMQELNWHKYHELGLTETIVNRENKEIRRIKEWSKRNDHRHHAMDALTIAYTKRSIIQYLNNLNARDDKSGEIYGIERKELERDAHGKLRFKLPFKNFREEAKIALENILISIKSKNKVVTKNTNKTKSRNGGTNKRTQLTPRGQLHLETIHGSIQRYATYEEKVGSSFNAEKIAKVANKREREALLARLNEFYGDAKKAFTGKNSLEKNPVYLDATKTAAVPIKVKLVELETVYTIRKSIDKDLNIEKVIDKRIRKILESRLKEYGNDSKAAFSNLDDNPIWLNKEKGICIKRVTISGIANAVSLREKKNHNGDYILDDHGKRQPVDFVNPGNNHHVAIYIDEDGNYQENIVSFFDATARAINEQPIIDYEYNSEMGWKFCFTLKQNEYFVFPNEKTGFNPEDIDLTNPKNYHLISPNLFRVQAISSKDYKFRNHLETTVEDNKVLKGITWKRIRTLQELKGAIKVRIKHIGQIVQIGE